MAQTTPATFPRTIGMDLGTRKSAVCVLDVYGKVIDECEIGMSKRAVAEFFAPQPPSRLIIEASGPCRWVSEVASSFGHEVVVANPREFRLIAESHKKTDRNDAKILAEFGQFRPHLLHPIQLRGVRCQIAKSTIAARDQLVRSRTNLINKVRSYVRGLGDELPSGASPYAFHRLVLGQIPDLLKPLVMPMLEVLATIEVSVKTLDQEIERLGKEEFPETQLLRQIPGVGPITALAFVATIEDPKRFTRSRDVGAYVGLVSISRDSGDRNPELRISKRGDSALRRLLVNSATYIIGHFGPDSDLKRFGEHLNSRGGQAARAKARIATARKLAVLLHRLWVTGQDYEPLRSAKTQAA